MTGHNDITGGALISKVSTKEYEEGWDRVFNKEKQNKNLIDGHRNSAESSSRLGIVATECGTPSDN